LEPLALGCKYISETLSPRSAIKVGGSVSKNVTTISFAGLPYRGLGQDKLESGCRRRLTM
jgi:hypothetical protein